MKWYPVQRTNKEVRSWNPKRLFFLHDNETLALSVLFYNLINSTTLLYHPAPLPGVPNLIFFTYLPLKYDRLNSWWENLTNKKCVFKVIWKIGCFATAFDIKKHTHLITIHLVVKRKFLTTYGSVVLECKVETTDSNALSSRSNRFHYSSNLALKLSAVKGWKKWVKHDVCCSFKIKNFRPCVEEVKSSLFQSSSIFGFTAKVS